VAILKNDSPRRDELEPKYFQCIPYVWKHMCRPKNHHSMTITYEVIDKTSFRQPFWKMVVITVVYFIITISIGFLIYENIELDPKIINL